METEKIMAYYPYYPISSSGGIVILDIKYGIDDKVLTAFYSEKGLDNKGWNTVYYHPSGETYFKKGGAMYFLDDFIFVVSNY